ncbi:LOW QUALITY PROTEIN: dynein regulatory complex protein 1-like [Acropora millepora]|uniref:LOW QUALITY PROTEIN: dynein regulatory complex protein 1-like n=1 Tax=Acropora millepora TaxID=45264 RepID=UPI001CF344AE|nr:LOW QUALITY PROTEIN: dynein regulatory complex protein 1-like [Acropora millepora]
MNSHEDEEDEGPSVDSAIAEERIAARRIRIQRRLEAAKREASGEDATKKKPVDSEKDALKSRKQMEDSRQRLVKLKSDGTELVTNVHVAADARESMRRLEEEDQRRQRNEKLEAEAKSAIEKFEEITKKWEYALLKEIPQDLNSMLMEQKAACDNMIDEKNKLIHDFQQELKSKDDQYVKDLKKAAEDVDLMVERMDEQMKQLTKAFREELTQIEKAFVTERADLIESNRKKWETAMQQRRDKEVEYMESRRKRVEDYENQLQTLRVQDAEEYNMVKIKLETDVQILEQQLQQMKATYQLNQEKLEYNFQVLKKRDEENTITKSQQKRKITRLQDVLNNLKQKLAKQEKQYKEDNQALTDDYKRITEQFRELQKKSRHFQTMDQKKFQDIWSMNEEQVKELVHNVMEEDRIIHEQQLGLPWQPPDLTFMEDTRPEETTVKPKEKQMSATQVAHEIMSAGGTDDDEDDMEEGSVGREVQQDGKNAGRKLSAKTIKAILELICDEAGFLVESKLTKLLAPLERDEQSLMKLDAIFAALGIDTEEDIYLLSNYFLNRGQRQKDEEQLAKESSTREGKDEDEKERKEDTGALPEEGDKKDDDSSVDMSIDEKESQSSSVKAHLSEMMQLIHPNEVVKALRQFAQDNCQPQKESKKQSIKLATGTGREAILDESFWPKMSSVIDVKKERVWSALLDGFEKYLSVLTERASLIQETDALRQQNAELRMLLHQYVNSRVNAELEIPPTRILQAELSKDHE